MRKNGRFGVAAGAVILNKGNQVLLTQRSLKRDHHPGEWEITTGRLKQGEDFQKALKREAKEELGIELRIIDLLETFHFFRGEEKVEHVGVIFLCRHKSGEVKVDGVEEIDFGWFDIDEAIETVNDKNIKGNIRKVKEYLTKN